MASPHPAPSQAVPGELAQAAPDANAPTVSGSAPVGCDSQAVSEELPQPKNEQSQAMANDCTKMISALRVGTALLVSLWAQCGHSVAGLSYTPSSQSLTARTLPWPPGANGKIARHPSNSLMSASAGMFVDTHRIPLILLWVTPIVGDALSTNM